MSVFAPVFDVRLDPPAVATNRTELKLNDGPIRVDTAGIDWGDAAIQAYMADMLVGSSAVDFRLPNRNVIIPLFVGADESESFDWAKLQLMNKVARLQAEGGWLQRQTGLYADVVNATLTFPDVWGEAADLEPNVSLNLECLPDFYSDEIALDPFIATPAVAGLTAIPGDTLFGPLQLAGQQAFIRGDHPARCRLVVANKSAQAFLSLVWGLRARYADPAGTARLSYRAMDLTPVNGSTIVSGSLLRNSSLALGTWMAIMTTNIAALASSPPMTHRGSYRVWAVINSTTQPQIRFLWGVGSLSVPQYNDAVTVPAPNINAVMDLGEVRLDAPPIGPMQWFGAIQAYPDQAGSSVTINQVWLQPLDDGGGRLVYNSTPPPNNITATASAGAGADNGSFGTVAWANPGLVTAKDNNPATVTFTTTGQVSHYLQADHFGFAIPAGATIVGIAVTATRKCTVTPGIQDSSVKLTAIGTVDKAFGTLNWGTAFSDWGYGGATDLWGGSTWTPAAINAATFGVLFAARGGPGSTVVGSVDCISMTVYYTFASGGLVQSDAVIYSATATPNQVVCEMRTEGMFRNDPTGAVYGEVSRVVGDLPRLPSSGMEKRPVEIFVKASQGDLAALSDGNGLINQIQAYYRPSYLFPP